VSVLVTGGAGYIGSHVVRLLLARGDEVVVVDRLSTGRRERIDGATLLETDLASPTAEDEIHEIVREHGVTGVLHFAALKSAPESVQEPERYYRQNLDSLANLLAGIRDSDVQAFVFSSSAAVYGEVSNEPVGEDAPLTPINPYGQTKLAGEWLVRAATAVAGIPSVSLRYFNVGGAGWPDLGDEQIGNLFSITIERVLRGDPPIIYSDDYATRDGTGVRDYVHVLDVAEAHLAALGALRGGLQHDVYNIGTGTGASVREVIDAVAAASGRLLHPVVLERRPGDPASVVADVSRASRELAWRSRYSLSEMVESAWNARAGAARSDVGERTRPEAEQS
jgi:UDP-glucose 4-epimerase